MIPRFRWSWDEYIRWCLAASVVLDSSLVAKRDFALLTPELRQVATLVAMVSGAVVVLWALRVRGATPAFALLALISGVIDATAGDSGHRMLIGFCAVTLISYDLKDALDRYIDRLHAAEVRS